MLPLQTPVLLIILRSPLCFSSPSPSTPPPHLSVSPSLHMCVRAPSWICLRGEEGGIKSVERTWQWLFSLSLHCFGPPQILFHGAKHPLPGISTAPISRRRFKPLSWHPGRAWRETGVWRTIGTATNNKHTYYLSSESGRRPAVLTHASSVSATPPTLVEGSHRDLDLGSPQHPPRFTSAHHLNHSGGRSHTKHTQKLSVKQSQMSLLKLHQLMNSTHNTKGLIVTFC